MSSPKLGVDTVCVNQPVNLTCWTDKQVKDITITWHWLSQSKEGTTIIVQATSYEVLYTCNASNICGQIGEAHVTVVADGEYLWRECKKAAKPIHIVSYKNTQH